MAPVYDMLGLKVGHVVHETTAQERVDHYRRNVVYVTSKELVADFLRDQIMLGNRRTSCQTQVELLNSGGGATRLQVPGLARVIVDEADSLLIDEAVTPLIISNSPDDNPNASLYQAADELARHLTYGRDFTIDRTVRSVDLTLRGQDKLES
jgi:preprotein translocase subunit SecA